MPLPSETDRTVLKNAERDTRAALEREERWARGELRDEEQFGRRSEGAVPVDVMDIDPQE